MTKNEKKLLATMYVTNKRQWRTLAREGLVDDSVTEYRRGITNGLLQACIDLKIMDEVDRIKKELGVD